jgi:hypothetical protein
LVIRQSDKLHAKVWIGDQRALVSSANASVNGLRFEGSTQNCWNEAGLLVDDEETVCNIRHWFDTFWNDENECRGITNADIERCPRRGPPAPPQHKLISLSDIFREDVCPIRLGLFCEGVNSKAADIRAARLIKKLQKGALNPRSLDNLSPFEIREGYPMCNRQAEDYGVGVTFKVDVKFEEFPPPDATFVRLASVQPVFYQHPSEDFLWVNKNDDKTANTQNSYAWNRGRTINLADGKRIVFDGKARSEIKVALERRWKNKRVLEIEKDEGILLWEIFK